MHAYPVLPSSLFIDKYQMSSANFLASNNLRALRALDGETDLEAPVWAVEKWGSAVLLELAPPTITNADEGWSATVPLHLRYQRAPASHDAAGNATAKDSTVAISIPWPVVFWACPAEEGTKMSTNPFDRANLGYDGLFGPRTMFYHVSPAADTGSLVESIAVPILDPQYGAWIEQGTVGTIVLGFLWVCWALVRPLKQQSGKALPGKGEKAD